MHVRHLQDRVLAFAFGELLGPPLAVSCLLRFAGLLQLVSSRRMQALMSRVSRVPSVYMSRRQMQLPAACDSVQAVLQSFRMLLFLHLAACPLFASVVPGKSTSQNPYGCNIGKSVRIRCKEVPEYWTAKATAKLLLPS